MRLLLTVAFLSLVVTAANAGSRCTFRVHLEANARDTMVFAQQFRADSGRDAVVERTAWLTEHDVSSFWPYRAADGSYGALLQLDDHGRTVLDTLSLEHRGSYLYIFVNGRLITELQIDRRVSDGRIYLASGLTEADVKSMAKAWKRTGKK